MFLKKLLYLTIAVSIIFISELVMGGGRLLADPGDCQTCQCAVPWDTASCNFVWQYLCPLGGNCGYNVEIKFHHRINTCCTPYFYQFYIDGIAIWSINCVCSPYDTTYFTKEALYDLITQSECLNPTNSFPPNFTIPTMTDDVHFPVEIDVSCCETVNGGPIDMFRGCFNNCCQVKYDCYMETMPLSKNRYQRTTYYSFQSATCAPATDCSPSQCFYVCDNRYFGVRSSGIMQWGGGDKIINPLNVISPPDNGNNQILKIIPNPSSNEIKINLTSKENGSCKVNIYNSTGNAAGEYNYTKSQDELDFNISTANYPSGAYIIKCFINGHYVTENKFIIE